MKNCDVLIVGGGPAGAACAGRLRNAGLDVIVLDRKTFPRDKTCAGWVTPQVLEELALDPEEYREGRTLEPITAFCVGMMNGRETTVRYEQPISYGIRRCEFDHYILEKSRARLVLGEPLKELTRVNGHWRINGQIETPMVIGAGGHFCPVARQLGARPGRSEIAVAAQEIEFRMTEAQMAACPIEPGVPYLYFCKDLKGYGWYYRKGEYLNVGLGREDKDELSSHVAEFCASLKAKGKIPKDAPQKFLGHAYLLYSHSRRKLTDDGALLIGDATGVAYAQSGEGIRPAIESGFMAADTLLASQGRTSAADLLPYETQMTQRFGQKLTRSWLDLIPPGLNRFLAHRLMNSTWFCRKVVVDKWFLNRDQPALV
ncbi:MAG: NAD(P)/FAD-dependent oxidoreductase [Gemmataceae bacterium]